MSARGAGHDNGSGVLDGEIDGRPTITLLGTDGELQATFMPRLGMVGCSLLHDGEQVLELRGGPAAYQASGSTFGIPLLHPWANRLRSDAYEVDDLAVALDPDSPLIHRDAPVGGRPIHGVLAACPDWALVEAAGGRVVAELDFAADPERLAAFPFPHRLRLCAAVSESRLEISLTIVPTGEVAVPVSFGWHPYLRLPRSDRRSWELTLPVRRRLVLDAHGLPTGEAEPLAPGALDGPLGDRTFDDCFDELERPARLTAADARREISVTLGDGYTTAQVYAPPGSDFICFEPMTAPVAALNDHRGLRRVQAGERFTATFTVTVAHR